MRPSLVPLAIWTLFAAAGCVAPANGPGPTPDQSPASSAIPSVAPPVAVSAPAPGRDAAPQSAGSAPDAGVLFVSGSDDAIYRYDGESGRIDPVWRASTFDRVGVDGAYVVGRHGGTTLLGWDGTTRDASCGTGYGAVSATGGCVSYGTDGVSVRLAGERSPRRVLPADWAAASAVWSPDGSRLLLVRAIRNRPGPGLDPGQSALWVLESDGRLREIYRPATQGILNRPRWSPDGRSALVWEIGTTSNSFAADGAGIKTLLVDIASGHVVDLGVVLNNGWAQWGPDGSLAYVSGGGRMTWDNKTLIVRAPSGRERIESAASGTGRVALAPDWDPVHGQLAWVSGPAAAGSGNGDGYIDGLGAGRRVGLIDPGRALIEVRCGEDRVVEGLRWSSDGRALLLLCRKPGRDARPLELWLHRIADGTSVPLVRGLASDSQAAGFGFYGMQPSLFAIVAWSHATR